MRWALGLPHPAPPLLAACPCTSMHAHARPCMSMHIHANCLFIYLSPAGPQASSSSRRRTRTRVTAESAYAQVMHRPTCLLRSVGVPLRGACMITGRSGCQGCPHHASLDCSCTAINLLRLSPQPSIPASLAPLLPTFACCLATLTSLQAFDTLHCAGPGIADYHCNPALHCERSTARVGLWRICRPTMHLPLATTRPTLVVSVTLHLTIHACTAVEVLWMACCIMY